MTALSAYTLAVGKPVKVDPNEIFRLYTQEGLTVATLAERMSVDPSTIRRWLRRALGSGWSREADKPVTPEKRERIASLARDGVPDAWIAEDVAISVQMVTNIRRDAGIVSDASWRSTCTQIRNNAELNARHLEFAPPTLRRG